MTRWILLQLVLYEILDVVPFVILAAAPYWNKIKSKKLIIWFSVILYVLGFARRGVSLEFPSVSPALSILWIALYLGIYYYVVREPLAKLLFVLVTVLNYASLVAILYSYLGYCLYPEQLQKFPYCFEASFTCLVVLALTFPFMLYWLCHKVSPLIAAQENRQLWSNLWLVPMTFCVFFYYNLYTSGSILNFSSNAHNLIFSLVISAGSFFVLYLVLRLVEISSLTSRLMSEKHQLELHTLQYNRLSERIEEARRARHDLRQCITVMQVYLKKGDKKHLRDYIAQVCSTFSLDNPMVYCLHPPLNALICYYAEWAAKHQVEFKTEIEYPQDSPMQDTDLVVLFGNMLENAAEACARQSSGVRYINLKVRLIGRQIVIILNNSCQGVVQRKDGSFCSSKRPNEGIGITSIRQIAGKYQGTAVFQVNKNVFSTSVMLNIAGSEDIYKN